jgi:hypothetical protein
MGADYLNPAASVELFAGTATKPAAFWLRLYGSLFGGSFFLILYWE